jgi:hypothetical protein
MPLSQAKGMTMTVSEPGASQPSRIDAEAVVAQTQEGQPMTVLDVRSPKEWSDGRLKVRDAIRIDRDDLHIDPSWPIDRLTIVY